MDPDTFRVRWCEVDDRIAKLWPSAGRVTRTSEQVSVEGRTLEVVVAECDPIAELERLIETAIELDFELSIYDRGVLLRSGALTVCGHGDKRLGTYEVQAQLETPSDDVRAEIERYPQLARLVAIAELALRVTHVEHTRANDRAHAAFTVALDDETRAAVVAWLSAHDYVQRGTTWLEGELVVAIDGDEATAYVRSRRTFAHGTDAQGVALRDEEVLATQIVAEEAVVRDPETETGLV